LYQIPHPHTGVILAERLMISLKQWKIEANKVLMVVTDNGSNMIKAVNTCKELLKMQAEAADEMIDSGSGTGTNSNEESVNEIEADDTDVIGDTDSDDDETECFPESVRRRAGMAQESNENEGYVSDSDSEIDNSDTVLDAQLDEALSLHRLPCVAHTSQLKEINKNPTYCNLI
jgi:hypothetical protein